MTNFAYPGISMLRRLLFCSNTPPDNHTQPEHSTNLGSETEPEPTYVELEEDERFFILRFEKKSRSRRVRTQSELIRNQERCKIYSGEEENCNPNEDPLQNNCFSSNPHSCSRLETVEVRMENPRERRRRRRKKKMKKRRNDDKIFKESELCKSENWSPVSVLDNHDVFTTSSDLSTTPEEEYEKSEELRSPNSRRNLSLELEEYKLSLTLPIINLSTLVDGNKRGTVENILWNEIGRVCREEIDESRWIYRTESKLQEYKDMGEELGDDITGDLLGELIDEMNLGI